MKFFHQKNQTWLTRLVALLVFAMLAQTLGAALLHVALVEHIWCESHGDFEHREADADHDTHADLDTSTAPALPHDAGGDHFPNDPRAPDALCFYLTSLHGPVIPQPPLLPTLTSLPPPAKIATARAPQPRTLIPRQIHTLHQAPGLSPPQRHA